MKNESVRTTPPQRAYIKTLFAKNGNSLSGDQLVAAATSGDSPIHDLFIWNNRRAGHLYRLRQAARILRSYVSWLPHVSKKAGKSMPSYKGPMAVKVKPAEGQAAKWVETANALEDRYMRIQVIEGRINGVKHAIRQLLVVPELTNLYEQLFETLETYMARLSEKKVNVRA